MAVTATVPIKGEDMKSPKMLRKQLKKLEAEYEAVNPNAILKRARILAKAEQTEKQLEEWKKQVRA